MTNITNHMHECAHGQALPEPAEKILCDRTSGFFQPKTAERTGQKPKTLLLRCGNPPCRDPQLRWKNLRTDVGGLWENFCITKRIKFNQNHRRFVNAYFWRTYDKKRPTTSSKKTDPTLLRFQVRVRGFGKVSGRIFRNKSQPQASRWLLRGISMS